jgi:hypothetical protein
MAVSAEGIGGVDEMGFWERAVGWLERSGEGGMCLYCDLALIWVWCEDGRWMVCIVSVFFWRGGWERVLAGRGGLSCEIEEWRVGWTRKAR